MKANNFKWTIHFAYGGRYVGEKKHYQTIEAETQDEAIAKFHKEYRSEIVYSVTKENANSIDDLISSLQTLKAKGHTEIVLKGTIFCPSDRNSVIISSEQV